MNRKLLFLLYMVTVFVAFFLHVWLQEWGDALILPNPFTYPMIVKIWGGISAYIPATMALLILFLLWDVVPGSTWWQKGVVFFAFMFLLNGGLASIILTFVEGGTSVIGYIILQLDTWIPSLVNAFGFAFIVHKDKQRGSLASSV